jgi:hypothetical protein
MSPTPRAAVALGVIAISALIVPLGLVALAALALAVATVVDAWSVRAAPTVSRTIAPVLSRGVPVPLQIAVRAPVAQPPTLEPAAVAGGVDVTAVTPSDLAAVRDFLARRDSLAREARPRVARALADRMAAKVGGLPPGGLPSERLLKAIAAAKDTSRYGSPER